MMFAHYFKIAFRHLLAQKGQTLICAIGLSMGILVFSVCTYIVTLISEVNHQFPEYKQMAELIPYNDRGGKWYAYPYSEVKKLKEARLPEIRKIVFGSREGNKVCSFQTGQQKETVFELAYTKINDGVPDYYSMQLVSGTIKEAFHSPFSLLISEPMAKKVYGNSHEAVGKTVKVENVFYTIRGVIKELSLPNQLTGTKRAELFQCCTEDELLELNARVALLLTPDADIKKLNRKIAELGICFNYSHIDPRFGLGDEPYHFKVERINEEMRGAKGFADRILLQSLGFLILLSGLINFFNLSIGSFYNRTRELSMRKSIGAGNRHLFFQLFIEQALTILLATILAFCLSETFLPWGIQLLDSVTETGIYLDIQAFWLETAVIFLELLIVSAFIVGITIWRIHKIPTMKGMRGGNATGNKHRVRNVMLAIEFLICLLFLGGSGMLYLQNSKMDASIYSTCPKEEQERTFIVPLTAGQLKGIEKEVIRKLTENSLVTEYLLTENTTLCNSETVSHITVEDIEYLILILKVSHNFPEFMHIPVLQGKSPDGEKQVIVTKALADAMEKEKMGNRLSLDSTDYTVCGIMDNISQLFKYEEGYYAVMPVENPRYCYLRCLPGNEQKLILHINQVMRQWIPSTLPVQVKTFYEDLNNTMLVLRIMQYILIVCALMCIFITILGIYAAITLDTEKRQKEVAIRKVNGATFGNIVLLFGKLYIRIFCIAALFGVPVLWSLATSIQEDFREKYNFNNPLFWLLLLTVTAGIIAITIGYRLYRIARINPVDTIKTE